jgi:hypothetical protein
MITIPPFGSSSSSPRVEVLSDVSSVDDDDVVVVLVVSVVSRVSRVSRVVGSVVGMMMFL